MLNGRVQRQHREYFNGGGRGECCENGVDIPGRGSMLLKSWEHCEGMYDECMHTLSKATR